MYVHTDNLLNLFSVDLCMCICLGLATLDQNPSGNLLLPFLAAITAYSSSPSTLWGLVKFSPSTLSC